MKLALWLLCMALSLSSAGRALAASDPRIASVAIPAQGTTRLQVSSETSQLLLFRPQERVESLSLSDPSGFFANVAGDGDAVSLRAAASQGAAIMTVRTSLRTYDFELLATAGKLPMIIRLDGGSGENPERANGHAGAQASERSQYRLSGTEALRPDIIRDDGFRTFLEWAGDRAMPATFAVLSSGKEQMIEGYMRDGLFTIDRVYDELIFRIDDKTAKARRQRAPKAHD